MKKNVTESGGYYLNFRNLILKMKLTAFILLFVVFQTMAGTLLAQGKFSLDFNNKTVEQVLLDLEIQTKLGFIYNKDLLDVERKVSINVEDATLDDILKKLFPSNNVTFHRVNNQVVISPKFEDSKQQALISGKVTDESGEPLPGVTVIIKGSTQGTVTNVDGNYTLEASQGDVLQFSFVGMKTKEVVFEDQTVINIEMVADAIGLEEVIAVGYGTQKKVNLTGAVASVKGEEMVKRPVTNPTSMLQGMVSGVQIVQNSGEPGNEGVSISIRGKGTFSSAGSSPLVLIDGVQGNLADVNPNNIENISVLKDAASAAIYGARAANGVVLVTTKTGEEGKVTAEYNGSFGIHTVTKMWDVIDNSAEYMELFNEARINSGLNSGLYSDEMINAYRNTTDRNLYPNTNWMDHLFSPAPTWNHNLVFSGGNKGTKFNISLGYVDQQGVMKGFDYKKYNIRANLTSAVNEKIRFGLNFSAKQGKKSGARQGADDTFLAAMAQAPTYSPQLSDGSGRYTFKAYDFESNNKNPIAIIDNNVNKNVTDYVISTQGWLDVELLKGLNWYTKAAINLDFIKSDDFMPKVPLYNFRTNEYMSLLNVGGEGLINQDEQNVYRNLFTYLKFDKQVGDGHTLNAQVGYSMEDNVYQYLKGYRKEFPTDILRELDAGSLSVQQANGTKNEWALMSLFGRLGYNFKDRYLFEANMRYDATSRLHADSRWGAFPSFSGAWRVTEEQFFKELDVAWLNNLKLRGSYGELGNQNIGLYPYQSILALTGNYSFDDSALSSGVAQTDLSNQNIKWETTSILDFGLDLTAFQGLSVTFDWYKKRTSDILRSSQVTALVGLEAPTVNSGTMENTGVELSLQYANQVKSGFLSGLTYNLGFNIDHYKNELVDFGEREIKGYSIREEGAEWDAFYMLEYIGIFRSEQEVQNSPKQFNDNTKPGDLKWKDQNNDGKIDYDDRVVMSGRYPAFNYSFNFASNWKGFDLSAQFQGVEDVKIFIEKHGIVPFWQGSPPLTEWRDRWTESNPTASMPRIYFGNKAPQNYRRNSSWFLQDASYLRLKNLTFGYTLPGSFTKRIGLSHLRLYFSGDNLLTITDYPGLDPERAGSGRFVNAPQNKIYSFGVNVKF
ncbi:TonB-dependent receptor [uncultured Draconibacterium sp.]|uniref:TonB-dependent receptor n=1 Tax=uncultured Draconibacterium sp. TaxID=1573823 RepID=UPI0025DBF3CF|nr:TonB-dependent receptor [uncultured Draconibacterium sp.]